MAGSPVDAEVATVAGYWIGIAGFLIGLAGVGFSIYTAFSSDPDHLIVAASGWIAAVLVMCLAGFTTVKLLRYVKSREDELRTRTETCHSEVLEARRETQSIQAEHERLLSISEYLVTKTVRRATKRAVPASPPHAEGERRSEDAD